MRSLYRSLRAPCRRRTYVQKPSGYWRKAGVGGTRAKGPPQGHNPLGCQRWLQPPLRVHR
eukprot:6282317-Amphidinium_carterae.1